MKCYVTLAYYTSDDGIWLWCSVHEWSHNLGWDPTPEQALEATNKHRENPDG